MHIVSTPITINGHTLKNRLTMAPTVKFGWGGPDGLLSDRHVAHYKKRAAHGVGLLCVEATSALAAKTEYDVGGKISASAVT